MRSESFANRVAADSAILAAVLACALCGRLSWTKSEIAKEAMWGGLQLMDYRQTMQTARNPDRFRELNPFLGEHPSQGEVSAWFMGWAFWHPVITDALPREKTILGSRIKPRDLWQNLSLAVSGACVINNFSVGLSGTHAEEHSQRQC